MWLNKNKNLGKGCDFLIKINDNCESYIEVKSKEGEDNEFLVVTGRQWSLARALNKRGQGDKYWIYVVNNVGKDTAKVIKICNPIEKWKDGLLYAHPINLKL